MKNKLMLFKNNGKPILKGGTLSRLQGDYFLILNKRQCLLGYSVEARVQIK